MTKPVLVNAEIQVLGGVLDFSGLVKLVCDLNQSKILKSVALF